MEIRSRRNRCQQKDADHDEEERDDHLHDVGVETGQKQGSQLSSHDHSSLLSPCFIQALIRTVSILFFELLVEQVVILQQEFLHAKSLVPKRANGLGDEEKNKFVLGYRKGIIKMIRLTLKLETQLLDGDNQAAQKTVKEMLDHQRQSHEKFKGED